MQSYSWIFFVLLLLGVALESAGDTLSKYSFIANNPKFLYVGFLLYVVASLCWFHSLKYDHLSKLVTIFTILNLIVVILIGVFFFEEKLSGMAWAGVVLGVVSVILMQF